MKTLKTLAVTGLIMAATISPTFAADKAPSKATTEFLKNAGIGSKFEIDSSQVALEKSKNEEVKTFAQSMIDDHTKAGEELKNVTASEDIDTAKIPSELDAKHKATLDKLENSENFDSDYVRAQTDAHKEAIGAFTKYSKSGDDKALKEFATNTLPTLKHHKSMIPALKNTK